MIQYREIPSPRVLEGVPNSLFACERPLLADAQAMCANSSALLLVRGPIPPDVAAYIDKSHRVVYACGATEVYIFERQHADGIPPSVRHDFLRASHFVDKVVRAPSYVRPLLTSVDVLWLMDATDLLTISRPLMVAFVTEMARLLPVIAGSPADHRPPPDASARLVNFVTQYQPPIDNRQLVQVSASTSLYLSTDVTEDLALAFLNSLTVTSADGARLKVHPDGHFVLRHPGNDDQFIGQCAGPKEFARLSDVRGTDLLRVPRV